MSHLCDGRALSCVTCAAIARRHDDVRAVMTLDDRLDDIKRVQIWTRIEDQLGTPVKSRALWAPIAFAAIAATVVGVLALRGQRGDSPAATVLTAPAEATLSAHLGPHTRAALVGPARLELVGSPGAATTVRLKSGTLLAEFTGGPGRSLRVEAPGAIVDIVGTLFAVEVRPTGTCVSVNHGKVSVTTSGGVIAVSGGESWCGDAPSVQPIAPAIHDALARHEAVITASVVPVAPPAPVAPAIAPAIAPEAPPAHAVAVAEPPPAPKPAPTTHLRASAPVAPPPPPEIEPAVVPAAHSPSPEPVVAPTPPPLPPPTPTPAPPPPPTAESLYEAAEAALAQRDLAAADRALARLVTDYPTSALLDQAIYERARIAYQRHAWAEAQRQLDQLAAIKPSALAEPGAYLSCRIAVEAHDGAAERCLVDYRKTYPSSPHDLDVLGLLVELAHHDGGCARAQVFVDELVRRYPRATLTRGWRTRCTGAP